ncbi:MAG: hypothetical protein Q9188_005797 [Gyalolechia gomerana]
MPKFKSANDPNYRRVQQQTVALVGEARAPGLGQLAQDEDEPILREDMARAPVLNEHSSMLPKRPIICHCLPFFTARFYRRDSYVAAIEVCFAGPEKDPRSLALHGMAGIVQDYDAFTKNLSLDLGGTDGQLQNRAKFQYWLVKESTSWLVIFDNVDNLASIKPFWPLEDHGSIIVTAKNPEVNTSLVQKTIHLEPFSESEGAKNLRSRLSDPSAHAESSATGIVKKLRGLPYALSHGTGFVEATSCTFEEVVDMYSYRADPELVDHDSSEFTFDYEKKLRDFVESLDLLRDETKAINAKPGTLARNRKAVGQLRRHSLVAKDALANHATDLNTLDRLEDADEVYRKAFRIRELPQNSDMGPELLGQLLSNAGRCWARMGRYPETEKALKKAIELRRQSLGLHNATAISYYGLGDILLTQGHLDEAILAEIEDTVNDGHAIPESRRLFDEAVDEAGAALPDNRTERDYDELVQFDHR